MSFFTDKTKLFARTVSIFLFILVSLFASPQQVQAVWDGKLYQPGTTLNPECTPTQTSCNIVPPVSQSGSQSLSGTLTLIPTTAAGLSLAPYGTASGSTSELRLLELTANGNNFIAFKSVDALTGNVVWTLPNADGTTGQVLSTSGAGVLSWTSNPTTTLTSGQLFVGNPSNVAAGVALSGDATINSTGALAIANGAVTSGKILDGTIVDGDVNASANIALSKLANGSNIITSLTTPTGSNVNGGSITSNVLTLSLADGTNPGLVSTGAQTFAGAKTFSGNLLANANTTLNGTLNITSTTSATNPGLAIGNGTNLGIAIDGADTVIRYTTTGASTFTVPNGVTSVRVLVVAGGGSGGSVSGGGGGAGGFRDIASHTVTPGAVINLSVGAGAVGSTGVGNSGSNSTFDSITSTGGGGGGMNSNRTGIAGGSGGGGSHGVSVGGAGNTPPTSPSQGNSGGSSTFPAGNYVGAGGGGAGAVGGSVAVETTPGNGGAGATSTITGGSGTVYAGGGGGGNYGGTIVGTGSNGGGNGGVGTGGVGVNATANTGSGGGGNGYSSATSGAGGSGIVIVRFATQTTTATTNNLAVDGSGNTAVSGAMTVTNSAGLSLNPHGTATGNTSELRFRELVAGGTNYTGFKSPDALAGNVLYTLPTADGTAGQVLSTNASGALSWSSAVSPTLTSANILVGNGSNVATGVALSGDATISNAGALTISANAIALGTDTTGNYVAGNTAGTGITVTGTAGEAWSPTLAIDQTAGLTWTGAHTFTNANGISLNPHGTATGNTSELRFTELAAGGTNYVGFKAPNAVGTNAVWTLPSADGSANQLLKTDGSGTLVWGNGSTALSGLSAAAAINTIDNQSFAQQWNWSTLSNQTGLTLNDGSITSGGLLAVTSGSTSLIGDLTKVEGTGSNAGITGNILKVGMTGASAAGTAVNITNAGTGLALRVNDDGTYADTSPFVVDASGQVGIGVAAPGVTLDVAGVARLRGQNALRFADADSSNYVAFQAPATVGTDLTWTLPSADGTTGQSLTTNGSGGLSWASSAGVSVGKTSTVHHSAGTALPITTAHNNAEIHAESTGGFTINGASFTEDTFGVTIVNTGGVSVTLTPSNFAGSFLRDGTDDAGFTTLSIASDTAYKLTVTDNGGSKFLNVIKFAAGGGSSQWTTSGANIFFNTGNVAIGTNTPSASAKLLISGAVAAATAGTSENQGLAIGNGTSLSTTIDSTDTVIRYTTTGASTFTVPNGVTSVRVLVVAGGGSGGGGQVGGGGGAGGFREIASHTVTPGAVINLSVGAGAAGVGNLTRGNTGGNSVFDTITSNGGGGGGNNSSGLANGLAGGSGGGGSHGVSVGGAGNTPPTSPSQGNSGGSSTFPAGNYVGAGGGGAGAVGGSVAVETTPGNGGAGATSTITGGSGTVYAGGGGGGNYGGTIVGTGSNGGGNGGVTGSAGTNATVNTGSGGGGNGSSSAASGVGGSGIVIVRFTTVPAVPAVTQGDVALLRVTDTGSVAGATLAFFESTSGNGCIISGQTGLACSSDASLKKNVNNLESSLDNILALRPVTYDWNYEGDGGGNHIGFIAQEVEQLFPGLVVSDPNGKKALAYDRFAPILVKSVQELVSEQKFITSRLDQTEAAQNLPTVSPSQLEKLVISGALTVGNLEVLGESIFRNIATFTADANFEKAVVFAGDVTFKGRALFEDRDMAGFAKIALGQDKVVVTYEKEYPQAPVVQISLASVELSDIAYEVNTLIKVCSKDESREACAEKATKDALSFNRGYAVVSSTPKGFTILLENPALYDLNFNWSVIPVKDAKTQINEVTPTPSPTPSPLPAVATPQALQAGEVTITPSPTPEIVVKEGEIENENETSPAN